MSLQRWREIEELYHSARESGEAVLAGADTELREQVRKLLAQDAESGSKLLDHRAEDLIPDLDAPTIDATNVLTGAQLGPYTIKGSLGQGGMGKVFRATDSRLGRSVAIKISDERFSHRFEHEARAIAALNHPNICTLHDVGPNYLVMELVEGETLAHRLKKGKLPLEQAVRFGAQIAEALAAAHAKGIVHGDLKPANIMLTKSGVKVLDFGLARSAADTTSSAPSVIMGTPAYMAPEQLEGQAVDARTDIYAFGLVLSEMVTGKRSQESGQLPLPLTSIGQRCLAKEPDDRWQSARDLKWALEGALIAAPAAASRSRYTPLLWISTVTVLLLAALGFVLFRQQTSPREPVQMSILLPAKSRPMSLAVSPDGRMIALVLVKDGKQQIWVRKLDSPELIPLEGTDGATNPFWSPDSRWIAFFADARLKKIDRSGGPVQTLCDALAALGGTWNQNGEILFGGLAALQRVSANGGAASQVHKQLTASEKYPVFLPDGEHYLATRSTGIWLGSISGADFRRLVPDASNAQFIAPSPGDHVGAVLFSRGNILMALPFDTKRLELLGDAFPIAHEVAGDDLFRLVGASRSGVLAYVSGQWGGWQYVWRDRQGKKLGVYPDAGAVAMVSPDGKRVASDRGGETWVLDFASGIATQLTFGVPANMNPLWSPDGRFIAYNKIDVGMYRKLASGAGPEELLVAAKGLSVPKSWSPDGKFIVYAQVNPGAGADLMGISVNGDRKPFPIVQTDATEDQGQFSPDGHCLAYTSNESGQGEIYVIPFPLSPAGGKWLVSRGGGVMPRWRRDGKELFYISPDSKMMAVPVSTRPVFQSGTPQALFDSEIVDTGIRTGPLSWDLAPDGKRFLIISPSSTDTSSLTVALNWGNRQ